MQKHIFEIKGQGLTAAELFEISHNFETVFSLSVQAEQAMKTSRHYIEGRVNSGEVMYGVNTGFGAFSSVRISDTEIEELQKNLIRSHSMGVGEPFSIPQTRAMMVLRANALATGFSGIRPQVVEKIIEFLNHRITPVIPSQGSVGASGDLAPLSHLALALIGEGEVWDEDGIPTEVKKVLQTKKIAPLELKSKEGLSLINGCQVMTAIGLLGLYEARSLLLHADIAAAMSLEGLRGSRKPFDPLISAVRPHSGEAITARNMLRVLGNSTIGESHLSEDHRVQDAYSLRCIPAVHGSAKKAIRFALEVLEVEANASTDNPLVFAKENKVLSCGNFHGMPVAHAMDFASIALASQASISECRISKLISTQMSELPAFLTANGGLNSGHMIVQVAAASLVSENKVLAHPASVDSIPTSAEKEDHVSMGTIAARKFQSILRNAENVVAMEFLSSAQAIDLLAPLKPADGALAAFQEIRKIVPYAEKDRIFSIDVREILKLVRSQKILKSVELKIGVLEF